MRVIGGEFRSRRLKSIPGDDTRPTPDRLRETLFDILGPRVEGVTFLDAYAGTGAVGIEALSRGARHAFFLEKSRRAIETIKENLAGLGLDARATVVGGPALSGLGNRPADIVFMDPPYDMEREYGEALAVLGERPPGLVVAQHTVRMRLEEAYGGLMKQRAVKQGDNVLSFFEAPEGRE
jgi:16S rRNA (guanine(966)-N(2))-methyltransferase RsmD